MKVLSQIFLVTKERESDDGGELQGGPFSTGHYSDGHALVSGVSLELSACRRADGRTRGAGRPRDYPALGREIQSPTGRGVPPAQAPGVGQLAHGSLPDATGKNALV